MIFELIFFIFFYFGVHFHVNRFVDSSLPTKTFFHRLLFVPQTIVQFTDNLVFSSTDLARVKIWKNGQQWTWRRRWYDWWSGERCCQFTKLPCRVDNRSTILKKKVFIDPPRSYVRNFGRQKISEGFSFRTNFVRAGIKMRPNFLRGLMTTTGEGRKIQGNAVFDVTDCATGRIKLYK